MPSEGDHAALVAHVGHPVAARALGLIKGFVGALDQIGGVVVAVPGRGFFSSDFFENHRVFQSSGEIAIIALPKIFFLLEIPENNNNKKREKEKIF